MMETMIDCRSPTNLFFSLSPLFLFFEAMTELLFDFSLFCQALDYRELSHFQKKPPFLVD